MNMGKGCYCEESDHSTAQTSFSKIDCCKEVLKEINNTSKFQFIQNGFNTEIVHITTSDIQTIHTSKVFFVSTLQNLHHIPPQDIPILNSTFRI